MGKVQSLGLAISQQNLDTRKGVSVAFPQFVVHHHGRIRTDQLDCGITAVGGVRLGDNVGVVGKVQEDNVVQPLVVSRKGDNRSGKEHKNQDVHPEQGVYLFQQPRHLVFPLNLLSK